MELINQKPLLISRPMILSIIVIIEISYIKPWSGSWLSKDSTWWPKWALWLCILSCFWINWFSWFAFEDPPVDIEDLVSCYHELWGLVDWVGFLGEVEIENLDYITFVIRSRCKPKISVFKAHRYIFQGLLIFQYAVLDIVRFFLIYNILNIIVMK